ncbi:MAG: endonuclease/exonuclease/phosphatase family protein [Planctomycetales bacterium]|nr:endonuclease/exonuclease/phosphatase family protein [Planctomycetales bacterium]
MRSLSVRRLFAVTMFSALTVVLVGCDVKVDPNGKIVVAARRAAEAVRENNSAETTATSTPPRANVGDTISIATFNIQVFGTSKLAKPDVMRTLVETVRRFDIVAIQEVRSSDPTVVPQFVDMINADGSTYSYVIGPRLGRTSSKEQYAIIYDASRIEQDPSCLYTLSDPSDLLHREPMAARFRTRTPPGTTPFSFTLVDIHTDPDETDQELDALDDVFVAVQNDGSGEDDVILLGDLNVDEYHLGQLGELPGIAHVVAGVPTNTRGTKTYDNIVYDRRATTEYTGQWGVLDLKREFGLSEDAALQVSDHQPVWAIFTAVEQNANAPVATLPGSRTR